jgi:ribose transport system permease protein
MKTAPTTPQTGEKSPADLPNRKLSAARVFDAVGNLRGLIALFAVFMLGVVFTPKDVHGWPIFLTLQTQRDVLFEYAEYGILATGMTLVILTGGIDLSVGSVLGFAATFFALLTIAYGWNPGVAFVVTVLGGAVIGSINGLLISRFKMQPFVATLAMMVAARGAAKWLSAGIKIQPGAKEWYAVKGGTPVFYTWMTTKLPVIGLQPATLMFIITIIVMLVVVNRTKFGRYLYAIGGNEEATRLSGINVAQIKMLAYILCGAMAAMGGISNAARLEIGDPEAGATYELDAIAAVVIGGTSLMGGRGGMFFTLIGVLIIGYINKILSINNVDEAFRLLAKGLIIVAAVLIQQKRRDRSG